MWLITTIVLGFLIGVLVSAPMGPVGVLCVRRTLHRGRREGLITGVGAMISDLLYAAASYKGITMVLAFGIHMYFSLPSYDVVDDGKSKSAWKLMTSAFFFALGNPLIAFVYMAFYSRYNFVPDTPTLGWHFVVAMLSIALGAIAWWFVITYLVLRLKENVSVGGLRIFNKILALVFIGISLVGLAMCLIKFT